MFPLLKVVGHDLTLVHVVLDTPYDLIVLVALSGKQYYITRAGLVNSRADRLAAVADAQHGRRFVPESLHDLVDEDAAF